MDAEFIVVFNDTKILKKCCVSAEKWHFLQRVLKMADFAQSAKGGPFAKFSKWADFSGWTLEGLKRKYLFCESILKCGTLVEYHSNSYSFRVYV